METTTDFNRAKVPKNIQSVQQKNLALVKKFYKLLDQHKFDEIESLLTKSHEIYYQSSKEPTMVKDMLPFVKMYYGAFPDYKHNLGWSIVNINKVSILMTYTATHNNKFMEIEPTNNRIDYAGIGMFEIKDGKIDKAWIVEDEMTMMKQIGAIT